MASSRDHLYCPLNRKDPYEGNQFGSVGNTPKQEKKHSQDAICFNIQAGYRKTKKICKNTAGYQKLKGVLVCVLLFSVQGLLLLLL